MKIKTIAIAAGIAVAAISSAWARDNSVLEDLIDAVALKVPDEALRERTIAEASAIYFMGPCVGLVNGKPLADYHRTWDYDISGASLSSPEKEAMLEIVGLYTMESIYMHPAQACALAKDRAYPGR